MTNNFPICLSTCLDDKVIVRGFFFEGTIEAFIFSWLVVSLEIMNHMYSYQKLNKFLYFFTKKLLYRRVWKFDCEIPLILVDHFV